MVERYIWVQGKRYYYFETYDSWDRALKVAKWYKTKNRKNQWFILPTETWFSGSKKYNLYFTRTIKIW